MEKEHLIKLTLDLYQLTLLFPKKEPLRYKMRELADEILAGFLRIKKHSNPSLKATEGSSQVLEDLEILDTYFAIANEQKWVSISKLLPVWENYSKIKEYLGALNKERSSFTPPVRQEKEEVFEKGGSEAEALLPPKKNKDLNDRQQKILEILKEKEKAQVWELKKIFPEITKRTLRRDFEFLLKQGIIERVGEKNETYYRIASRT